MLLLTTLTILHKEIKKERKSHKSYWEKTRRKQNTTFKLRSKIFSNLQQRTTIHGHHLDNRNLCAKAREWRVLSKSRKIVSRF